MYARMDRVSGQHGCPEDPGGPAASASTTPGSLGSITLSQLAGPAQLFVTFWDARDRAASVPGPHSVVARQPGHVHEVTEAREGSASMQTPSHALLLYFDGPRLPELAAAAEHAWRQRLWPAIRAVDGLVATYLLQRKDLGSIVIHLGTSLRALEAISRSVQGTGLLPGEDPALLPGPDRIELHYVTGYHVAASRSSAAAKGR